MYMTWEAVFILCINQNTAFFLLGGFLAGSLSMEIICNENLFKNIAPGMVSAWCTALSFSKKGQRWEYGKIEKHGKLERIEENPVM